MDIKIKPNSLKGSIIPPPSKSIAHRAIIAAALSSGTSKIKNISYSEDIISTIEAMEVLGAKISKIEDGLKIEGVFSEGGLKKNFKISERKNKEYEKSNDIKNEGKIGIKNKDFENRTKIINCRESGSTIRFLIPLLTLFDNRFELKTEGRLLNRPMKSYFDIFDDEGIFYEKKENTLIVVGGKIFKNRKFYIDGSISSQFITGMLFVLPLLEVDSEIIITNNLESRSYVDITISILKDFGIYIENHDYKVFKIRGLQKYKATDFVVEADYSQAAFFLVAKHLGNRFEIQGLSDDSLQGDREIVNLINLYAQEKKDGIKYDGIKGTIKDDKKNDSCENVENTQKKIIIDGRDIPDIIPVFSLFAALQEGFYTEIKNLERLKLKESDRLMSTYLELKKLGAKIDIDGFSLKIWGQKSLKAGVELSSHKDHRIAMMLAIAATTMGVAKRDAKDKSKSMNTDGSIIDVDEIIIKDADSVKKSYPSFWDVYEELGGVIWRLHGEENLR